MKPEPLEKPAVSYEGKKEESNMEIRRCMHCMHELKPGQTVCPECGQPLGSCKTEPFALKPGTILNGTYLVGEMLGQGGFGITYIGFDLLLEQKVAIKEYFPMSTGMVSRDNQTGVVWSSAMMEKTGTQKGFDSFLKEARKMAKLKNIPNVVGVNSVFIQNETAYIVMDFIEGETLLKKLQREGPMRFETCVSLLTPIMQALAKVHQHGIIHRDISPDNIMVQKDGQLILLDLGAAKDLDVQGADGTMQSSQLVAKQGFSPFEQYGRSGKIGPWTDAYAMAATIYYCCTGTIPPTAIDRIEKDTFSCRPLLTSAQFDALAACMTVLPGNRPKDMDAMLEILEHATEQKKAEQAKPEPVRPKPPQPEPPKQESKPKPPKPEPTKAESMHSKPAFPQWLIFAAVGIAVLCAVIGIGYGSKKDTAEPVETAKTETPAAAAEISLWTYPIGGWGSQETVDALMADFEAATGIKVNVECLTYADGDDKINTAIERGQAPDLIMGEPERLASWDAKGKMVNIADMYDDTDKKEINAAALAACFTADGSAYAYPLCMTTYCMAINQSVFENAGAMEYIDAAAHTWTTENFFKAVETVYEFTGMQVGAIYCASQGGDQGTCALVNNLYGGSFTNPEHTKYTWDTPENVAALTKLYELDRKGIIKYNAGIAGGDEIALFCNGTLNVAFCWNMAQQMNPNSAGTGAGKTAAGDDILFMAFPSASGTDVKLRGTVWGFGIFDNGDQTKIDAAKTFIKYFCDSGAAAGAVRAANYFAVRDTAEGADLTGIWDDNEVMAQYSVLMPLMGDYYQVTPGWAEARIQWRNMLQQVGAGSDIAAAAVEHAAKANAAAGS